MILNDKNVVSSRDVSVIPESRERVDEPVNEELASAVASEKAALRRNIEEINNVTPGVAIFSLMRSVDPTMSIRAMDTRESIDELRKILLHKALNSGKIDPKKCVTCGQIIPE